MKGLIVREPWIGKILNGEKDWELRSKVTSYRGPIALIRKGSGCVVGTARLTDCLPPLDARALQETEHHHGVPEHLHDDVIQARWLTPWVLEDIRPLVSPVPYEHPNGAVTWVSLTDEVASRVKQNTSPDASVHSANSGCQDPSARMHGASPAVLGSAGEGLPATGASDTQAAEPWVEIPLTQGNVDNNHFRLRPARHLFDESHIGGGSKLERAQALITVEFVPGSRVETDIDGKKMILRERGSVGEFFRLTGARAGDAVKLKRLGPSRFEVRLNRR